MWSFKEHELLQADSFAATWNNFLGRTTSRPGDRHQIMAAMQDFKFDSIYSLQDDANARMKAILKGHSYLPLALLFSPSAKVSRPQEINAWAPELPQGSRLDCSLGYMKVFTDCLFVLPKYVAGQVTVCVLPIEVSTFECFQIANGVNSDREQLWIEMEPSAGQQQRPDSFTATCIIFPSSSYRWKSAQGYESRGARFLLRIQEQNDLRLIYDRPFRLYSYDRSKSISQQNQRNPKSYPCFESEIIQPGTRVFIDCGKLALLPLLDIEVRPNIWGDQLMAHSKPLLRLTRRPIL
ncbi:hypothetical protein MMC14_001259 [Varicellaria rhodocarpa]|nr:hypothetical protein [Varicellaria rhodocarpa]